MVFFDLSVPYLEIAGAKDSPAAQKAVRLRVVVKAMELGYSGVAFDHSIRGVMSDRDRCMIPPFPLSSLLKVAPTLSASVRFHRQLLGIPISDPFRQYKRLTVAADTVAQVAALNSGNPVLRTYDLVAIRPLSQAAFDQACNVAEVDLIAIDFSQKLPFRLKLAMVKAAIERGICFEITYSHFISNVRSRRQMLSGAKLLVDWTRGKNLIFSSAATSADEVRGPNDVANLASLLGLSTEKAKAAISKNCRVLLDRALKKKQFYKEAIKIEKLSPSEQLNSRQKLLTNWSNWDPISSGDGDLMPLKDLAKHFSNSTNVLNNPIKVANNPFKELDMCSNDNASQDLFSWRQESLLPPDNNITSTQEMQSYFTGNKAQWHGKLDDVVSDNDGINQGCTPPFSICAKPTDSDSERNELATSNELDLSGTSALTPINSSLKVGIHDSRDKLSSFDNSPMPTPNEPVDSSNMDTRDLGCSDEILAFSGDVGSSIDRVPVVDITNVSICDNAEVEMPKETVLSFAITDESSDYETDTRALAAQEVLLSSNTENIEDATAPMEDNKKSTLASFSTMLHDDVMRGTSNQAEADILETYNASLHEGVQNAIISEKDGQRVSDVMLIGGGFDELIMQRGVLALPAACAPLKENQAVEQGYGPSMKVVRSRKEKAGRGKFIQKLRREALHVPSRGLFKPLLFRRKGSRKHYSTRNHDAQW